MIGLRPQCVHVSGLSTDKVLRIAQKLYVGALCDIYEMYKLFI